MPSITIETEEQLHSVERRIAQLASCLDDTPEKRELVELTLAYDIWETKRWKGPESFPTD
ncbi:hypothetical protein [Bosea sp. 685]|uniref:hypothetical protein n=1 Tax=Bosea sp. 685 TaxID=3080057 RepID=UPI0028936072|nr:hypothetical protein [Bosea sp. 685]WNJ93035.1 hypothetical protein RMR04_12395 [Bosea sp. 685]